MSRTPIKAKGRELTRSELEIVIFEANLRDADTFLAVERFIRGEAHVDICNSYYDRFRIDVSRATVTRRLEKIQKRLTEVANQIRI